MRKPAFCIFLWPLYSDIIFFIDQYCAGVSNKHCLLPFFHLFIFMDNHWDKYRKKKERSILWVLMQVSNPFTHTIIEPNLFLSSLILFAFYILKSMVFTYG